MVIWSIATGQELFAYIRRSPENWAPQWTDDDKYCLRGVANEIHFFESTDFKKGPVKKCVCKGVHDFKVAPGPGPVRLVLFIPSIKGAAASVRLFHEDNLSQQVASKSFFKADSVLMVWNYQGTACLVQTKTETDTSGKSYYGETNLYYMALRDGASMLVTLDKEGPISDFAWAPNGKEFCVVYGNTPIKAAIFNQKCDKVFDFGTGPRNTVQYSPHGNIIMMCGLGAIGSGTHQFWGRGEGGKARYSLVSELEKRDCTDVAWCPDSEHFLMATCFGKIKMDNCLEVQHYSGKLVYSRTYKHLNKVEWRPVPAGVLPEKPIVRSSVAGGKAQAYVAPEKATYRPPGLRGTASTLKLHEEELADSEKGKEKTMSKSQIKNAKRKKAKEKAAKNSQIMGTGVPGRKSNNAASDKQSALAAAAEILNPTKDEAPKELGAADYEKKIRNLTKKLRQIIGLKEKQAEGVELQQNQVDKINDEGNIQAEVDSLTAKLAALS